MNTSVTLTYVQAPAEETTTTDGTFSFALEQEEYPFKSPGDFEGWLEAQDVTPTVSNLIQAYEEYKSACTADGVLDVGLRVYLSDTATEYNLVASHGTMGPGALVEEARTERVELDVTDKSSVEFGAITAAEFDGDVRDATGAVTDTPDLSFDGQQLTVSEAIDATVAITTTVAYFRHVLTIEPRDATEEQLAAEDFNVADLYASTVKLYAGGQKKTLEITMPDNWGTCEGGYSIGGGIGSPDGDDKEYAVKFEAYDFCDGDPIEGADFVVDGAFLTDPEAIMALENGEHTILVTAPGYKPSDLDDLDENDKFTLPGDD